MARPAGWRKRGWKTADGQDVKNQDLWCALDEAALRHDVEWHWVRGHAGNEFNERADRLAAAAIADGRRRAVHVKAAQMGTSTAATAALVSPPPNHELKGSASVVVDSPKRDAMMPCASCCADNVSEALTNSITIVF